MAGEAMHSSHSYSHLTALPWHRTVVDTWGLTTGNSVEAGGRKQSRTITGKPMLLMKFLVLWFMKVLYKHLSPRRAVRLMAQLLQLPNAKEFALITSQTPTPQNMLVAEV